MAALAPQLTNLQKLEELDLEATGTVDQHPAKSHAPNFAPYLGSVTSLKGLSLASCRMQQSDGEALAPAIGKLSKLTYLSLEQNCLGCTDTLFRALQKLKSLCWLRLAETHLSASAAQTLAYTVSSIASLQRVDIGHSNYQSCVELRECSQQHCQYQIVSIDP